MIIDHVGHGLIIEEGLQYMHKARTHSDTCTTKCKRKMGHT
jgi:hypothetical protein